MSDTAVATKTDDGRADGRASENKQEGVDGTAKQAQMRAELVKLGVQDSFDDRTLQRYLRARNGNVGVAAKLLQSTVEWRASLRLDTLSVDEFPEELACGKMYVAGRDAEGRSILITRKRTDVYKAGNFDHYLRHLAFTLDSTVRAMQNGQEKWVWILDMNGFTHANSPPLNVSMATTRITTSHYPERLHRCFFVDAPSFFSWMWNAVYPFLDTVTRAKIHFVSSAALPAALSRATGPGAGPHATAAGSEGADVAEAAAAQSKPGDAPAAFPATGKALSTAMAEFLPYVEAYRTPYDEAAFRALLSTLGW